MSTKWNPAKSRNNFHRKEFIHIEFEQFSHRIWEIYGFEMLDLKSLKLDLCIDKLFKSDFKC